MIRNEQQGDARKLLLKELGKRKHDGIYQREFEVISGFSKSHISETLTTMEKEGRVIRNGFAGPGNRIWLPRYFPRYRDGFMRIGMLRSSEYSRATLAIERYCKEKDIEANFYVYDSVSSLLVDQSYGVLEITMAPVVAQLMYAFTRRNILICDFIASQGSALLSNLNVKTNVLATTEPSSMMLLAREAFQRDPEAIISRYEDPCVAVKNFLDGKFGKLAIWEPYVTELTRNSNFVQSLTYRELLGSIPCCSMAFSEQFLDGGRQYAMEILEENRQWRHTELSEADFKRARKLIKTKCVSTQSFDESVSHYDFDLKFDRETIMNYLEKSKLPFSFDTIKDRLIF